MAEGTVIIKVGGGGGGREEGSLECVSRNYRQAGEAHSQARTYRMSAGVKGRLGKLVVKREITGCQLEL